MYTVLNYCCSNACTTVHDLGITQCNLLFSVVRANASRIMKHFVDEHSLLDLVLCQPFKVFRSLGHRAGRGPEPALSFLLTGACDGRIPLEHFIGK
jgi:hypothetical protein